MKMDALTINPETVPGWGFDADPNNDPTYPYRDRAKDDGPGRHWKRPPLQNSDVEILQSIEHVQKPAVFGTSAPPRAVSGAIRRLAFRWSESNWTHWLLLMGADRINVVEGVVENLGRLKVPNIPAEMGAKAEWRHNKKGFVTKAGIALGATALLVYALRRRGDERSGDERRDEMSDRDPARVSSGDVVKIRAETA